jgi:hypothetical protein
MVRTILEDLAFPNYSLSEPDKVGSEDMCEHETNTKAVLMVADGHSGVVFNVVFNKGAKFRRTEKNSEEMALKIWAELRQLPRDSSSFIESGTHYCDEPVLV